jgi:hypothetical protein
MAVGGALRAALRAGRFGTAARESRRQARAVRSINERGGFRMAPEPSSSLEMRGYDRFMGQGYGETARGNAVIFDPYTGARTVLPQTLDDALTGAPMPRGPIEAPYEGFRVWPGTRLPGFGEEMQVGAVPGGTMRSMKAGVPFSVGQAPPWIGRGSAPTPTTGRFFPRDMSYGGGRMYDYEMGPLQGQQFFAPSAPVPALPRYSFDDFGREVPFIW